MWCAGSIGQHSERQAIVQRGPRLTVSSTCPETERRGAPPPPLPPVDVTARVTGESETPFLQTSGDQSSCRPLCTEKVALCPEAAPGPAVSCPEPYCRVWLLGRLFTKCSVDLPEERTGRAQYRFVKATDRGRALHGAKQGAQYPPVFSIPLLFS